MHGNAVYAEIYFKNHFLKTSVLLNKSSSTIHTRIMLYFTYIQYKNPKSFQLFTINVILVSDRCNVTIYPASEGHCVQCVKMEKNIGLTYFRKYRLLIMWFFLAPKK